MYFLEPAFFTILDVMILIMEDLNAKKGTGGCLFVISVCFVYRLGFNGHLGLHGHGSPAGRTVLAGKTLTLPFRSIACEAVYNIAEGINPVPETQFYLTFVTFR